MVILPDLSIYRCGFSNSKNINQLIINNILLNSEVKVCLNKSMLVDIEKVVEDEGYFQSLIRKLYDDDRIYSISNSGEKDFDLQLKEIISSIKLPIFFPLTLKKNDEIDSYIFINDIGVNSRRNSIILNLLKKNEHTVSHIDFVDNTDINIFFEEVFSIPNNIRVFNIFNRNLESKFLSLVKGSRFNYYTLIRGKDIQYASEDKQELKKIIGSKLKIFFTTNPRIIHERKIIFENLIITIDNSFENILKEEPTWQIQITYSSNLATSWHLKCDKFREVKG